MAKFQTLGLSDDGEKKPSGEAAKSQPPEEPPADASPASGSPPQQSAATPLADVQPIPVAPATSDDQVPEWDALVDALTQREAEDEVDWHPKPWVPPAEEKPAESAWDSLRDTSDKAEASPHQMLSQEHGTSGVGDMPIPAADMPAAAGQLAAPPKKRGGIKGWIAYSILLLLAAAAGVLGGLVFVHSTDLPQIYRLMEYRPDVMTELYADDGTQVGSFALEHRIIVTYDQIPKVLRDAVLSTEDRHFESHWGVDIVRVAGAAFRNLTELRFAQGASTLTMQWDPLESTCRHASLSIL